MITKFELTFLIILSITSLSFSQVNDLPIQSGKLTVKITGFSNNEGNCRFALANSEEVFEREDSVWIGKVLPIKNKKVEVTIDSLSYGVYAIKVFHDKNRNEELDTNILGIPSEDYAYSNDASGIFGPPSWNSAKFVFNKPEMTVTINID